MVQKEEASAIAVLWARALCWGSSSWLLTAGLLSSALPQRTFQEAFSVQFHCWVWTDVLQGLGFMPQDLPCLLLFWEELDLELHLSMRCLLLEQAQSNLLVWESSLWGGVA